MAFVVRLTTVIKSRFAIVTQHPLNRMWIIHLSVIDIWKRIASMMAKQRAFHIILVTYEIPKARIIIKHLLRNVYKGWCMKYGIIMNCNGWSDMVYKRRNLNTLWLAFFICSTGAYIAQVKKFASYDSIFEYMGEKRRMRRGAPMKIVFVRFHSEKIIVFQAGVKRVCADSLVKYPSKWINSYYTREMYCMVL